MNKLYCNQSSQYLPIFTELEDFRATYIANCVFNIFLSYTAFMLNIVTIYAIHKTATMPKTLKTLLLSLACSDVTVGLFSQPLYTFFLINWLRLDNPSCIPKQVGTILGSLFSAASFLGVVAVSVDRFLAVHLHLRYQELVTHRRVVVAMISIWVYSAFVSLITLWGPNNALYLISTINAAFGFIITLVVYIRIYLTVRRHKNEIQSIQIRNEAQSEEIKNLTVLIKSTVGIFYVYLVVNLLFVLLNLRDCYSNLRLDYRFKNIVYLFSDSLVSQFNFEPRHLLLEDETHSTRYRRHTTKDVLEQQSATSDQLQSVIECRPY